MWAGMSLASAAVDEPFFFLRIIRGARLDGVGALEEELPLSASVGGCGDGSVAFMVMDGSTIVVRT